MAGNGSEGLGDDFFEQILAVPEASVGGYGRSTVGDVGSMPMVLQLGSTSGGGNGLRGGGGGSLGIGVGMPLGLNLEQAGFMRHQSGDGSITNNHHHQQLLCLNNNHNGNNSNNNSTSSTAGITDRDMHMRGLFSGFGQLHSTPSHTYAHAQTLRPTLLSPPPPSQPQLHHHHHQQPFQSQPQTSVPIAAMPQPPGIRPRVRARRGQATDPHSIAERLRRERIAERMKALQELVPSINKTDRAVMLDEIMDYVKFLRLQVKVLSMSRLGGAGAVAQLVSDVPLSAVEGEDMEGGANQDQQAWDKWSSDGTEQQVAKLMEEDVGAAMQFLQSKALCIMPISLASAIFRMPQSEASSLIKPESNSHS